MVSINSAWACPAPPASCVCFFCHLDGHLSSLPFLCVFQSTYLLYLPPVSAALLVLQASLLASVSSLSQIFNMRFPWCWFHTWALRRSYPSVLSRGPGFPKKGQPVGCRPCRSENGGLEGRQKSLGVFRPRSDFGEVKFPARPATRPAQGS